MNKKRRCLLKTAKPLLDQAASIIELAMEQESDCVDNMPESLQDSEQYEKMELAIDNLQAALEHIESTKDCIDEAVV